MTQTGLFDTVINSVDAEFKVGQRAPGEARVARRLADQGAQRAADHADGQDPGWFERALVLLIEFCAKFPREEWTSEDVRKYAESKGLPRPPDGRAWGAVLKQARKSRLIWATGLWRAGGAICHGRPQRVWSAA